MEVQKEAQRIMTLSVWKMYNSRLQRGGLRLHRSLQLSLVMRSAREVYLSPCPGEEGAGQPPLPPAAASPGPPAGGHFGPISGWGRETRKPARDFLAAPH
uniref:Immediate early response 2 n=1 Tax=Terrapene triunguis TaxID=2587831 RepID=A0A674JZF4_9SAUR